jgi:hypothetical protein
MQGKWSPCERRSLFGFGESEKIMIADKGEKERMGKKSRADL